MQDNELIAQIQLIRSYNVGEILFYRLMQAYNTANNAIEQLAEILKKTTNQKNIKIYSRKKVIKEIEETKNFGAEFLSFEHQEYPRLLSNITNAPPILVYKGDVKLLNSKIIGIVGARSPSINAFNFTKKIALALSESGFIVSSGMAVGIDSAAHSIIDKNHASIAVIATGINIIYPEQNYEIANILYKDGLIITELPINTKAKSCFFPRRNRIISGISLAVLVIEASTKSGSLITAKLAFEQNKPVFAVPSFPDTTMANNGCNLLIKMGAKLVESHNDVIDHISINSINIHDQLKKYKINSLFEESRNNYKISEDYISSIKKEILNILQYTPTSIEDILLFIKIPVREALISIIELELEDVIVRDAQDRICKKFK